MMNVRTIQQETYNQIINIPEGYYCPSDAGNPSTNATAMPCGDVNKYCPEKSHSPFTVDIGYYSIGGEEHGSFLKEQRRADQKICPPGSYCEKGRKFPCPEGTFGKESGLFKSFCSGFCPEGYFCTEGSIEPQECEINTYATPGNRRCVPCNNPHPSDRDRCRTSRLCCNQ